MMPIRAMMKSVLTIMMFMMCISMNAQMDTLLFVRDYHIDSLSQGTLAVEIDNISFFKDNEYDAKQVVGYTLPGLWIQPKVTYQPLSNIKIEAGVHSLIFFGKRKYPNTAYQDIASWKGYDYMDGTHLLPYFRANFQMGKVNVVLGDIYGGSNHRLIDPLYSPELNLTSDPEMGLQMLVDLKRWHLDAWVDWQSFIFKNDMHQESFVFGGNSEVRLGKGWTLPVQAIVQHRGGELQVDEERGHVNTLINYSAGICYYKVFGQSWMDRLNADTHFTGYLLQKGQVLNVDNGWGAYAHCGLHFKPGLQFDASYFYNSTFVSLLGTGHYTCIGAKATLPVSKGVNLYKASLEYARAFGKYYTFGARTQMYLYDRKKSDGNNTLDVNFGVFMKCNPQFILKVFK